jgi:hypothetical protein
MAADLTTRAGMEPSLVEPSTGLVQCGAAARKSVDPSIRQDLTLREQLVGLFSVAQLRAFWDRLRYPYAPDRVMRRSSPLRCGSRRGDRPCPRAGTCEHLKAQSHRGEPIERKAA